MRAYIVAAAWFWGVALCGCSSTDNGAPSLRIVPEGTSGTVAINGPTNFTAVLVNSDREVKWMASAGALSQDSGLHVTLTPPPGTTTATLTAAAGDLTATVQVASSPLKLTDKTIPGLTAAVSVQYDAQDIPHIQCAQAIDCIAVQGYIQARDRLFPMDFLRHVAEGKLSEMIGLAGLSQDVTLRTVFTTRGGNRLEDELTNALDAKTRELLTAFTSGVNAYITELRATQGALPGEYRQLPFPLTPADIPLWRIQDTLAIGRLNQFQLSETLNGEINNALLVAEWGDGGAHPDAGKLAAYLRAASPKTERGHTLSAGPGLPPAAHASTARPGKSPRLAARQGAELAKLRGPLAALAEQLHPIRDRLRPLDGSVGSNNWAVSAAKSSEHAAMVANDPHLSLQYPPLFHLSALTSSNSADNLDLTGGSFPGVPGALVGRGKHVGWGVTVVGYDVTDIYIEKVVACPPGTPAGLLCFAFGPSDTPVVSLPVPQSYSVRIGPGNAFKDATQLGLPASQVPPAFTLIVPHHGPIVRAPKDGVAFSARWTGMEGNTLDTRAIYGLNTAVDVDAAIEALKDFATGAQNFVLADDTGHIAYDPHALVPIRSWAVKGSPVKPWLPLPSDGAHEWGTGTECAAAAGAPRACFLSDDQLPHGKDPMKGYYFTANSDPLGVSDDNQPMQDPAVASDPPYLSFDWSDSSGFRSTRIEQLIEAAIARGGVSLADMEAIQSDHVSRPGMAFAPIIAAIPSSAGPAEFGQARAVLDQWATTKFDCPTGLSGIDPHTSAAVTDAPLLQASAGCFLFHAFIRTLVKNVFTDDLSRFGQGIDGLAALKALLLAFDPADPDAAGAASFCNDVAADGKVTAKTCAEQVVTALVQAYSTLSAQVGRDPSSWIWGRVHTMQPVSLLALVTTGYSPGPYARPGGAFTVDVGSPSLAASGLSFGFSSSGNVRHISLMDPARPRVRMQLPGPVRDGPAVVTGPDLLGQWVRNTYFDYAHGDQIGAAAVTIQSFKAP